ARGHERHIAQALDGVAKTLLVMQQDRPAAEVLAIPQRLRNLRSMNLRKIPTVLVLTPPALVVPEQQEQQRHVGVRLVMVGLRRDGALECDDGLLVSAHEQQDDSEIGQYVGVVRIGLERLTAALHCLGQPDIVPPYDESIEPYSDIVRLERQRANES